MVDAIKNGESSCVLSLDHHAEGGMTESISSSILEILSPDKDRNPYGGSAHPVVKVLVAVK